MSPPRQPDYQPAAPTRLPLPRQAPHCTPLKNQNRHQQPYCRVGGQGVGVERESKDIDDIDEGELENGEEDDELEEEEDEEENVPEEGR